MPLHLRPTLALILAVALSGFSIAQSPARAATASRRYCQPEVGFCFRYPSTWSVLGEVFAGNGVVIAPEQKQDRALWDEITVGLIVPPPKGDADPVSVDQFIEQTMASLREEGQNLETVQRQLRTIDGKPAQLLTLRYQEKGNSHDWVEKLALIEGSHDEIYSVALKCSPDSLVRLEPILSSVLQSWKLPEPPSSGGDSDTSNSDVPPKEAPTQAPPDTQSPPKAWHLNP